MAVVDGARAVVVAALAWLVATGQAGITTLAAAALLLALLGTLFDASAFALLPAVVPPTALARANAHLQAGTTVAGGFVGAPLAGVLFATAAALPFTVDALTFALAAALVLAIPRRSCTSGPDETPESRRNAGRNRKIGGIGVWREGWEGVRWVWGDRGLRGLALASAGSNLAISGLAAVLVLYALEVLRVPAAAYGLFSAGVIAGGLVGALLAGRLAARFGTLPALRGVLLGQTLALTGFRAGPAPADRWAGAGRPGRRHHDLEQPLVRVRAAARAPGPARPGRRGTTDARSGRRPGRRGARRVRRPGVRAGAGRLGRRGGVRAGDGRRLDDVAGRRRRVTPGRARSRPAGRRAAAGPAGARRPRGAAGSVAAGRPAGRRRAG